MSLSLKLSIIMIFKQNRILMKAFVEAQFEVIYVKEFQTKLNSSEHLCWVSALSYVSLWVSKKATSDEGLCWVAVWSYLCLWVWNKSEFLWRHLLSLSLKLCKFMCFKEKWILMKTFLEPQFGVAKVYEFQTKANSYGDIF